MQQAPKTMRTLLHYRLVLISQLNRYIDYGMPSLRCQNMDDLEHAAGALQDQGRNYSSHLTDNYIISPVFIQIPHQGSVWKFFQYIFLFRKVLLYQCPKEHIYFG